MRITVVCMENVRYTKSMLSIYYEEALQSHDNSKYFLMVEYLKQALTFAQTVDERKRVMLMLKMCIII